MHFSVQRRFKALVEGMDKSEPSIKTKLINPDRITKEEALHRASSM
jgi:hypothetical protein